MELAEERLKFTLEEYIKIKEENLTSINAQHSTLNFGLAAISILFAAVGQVWDQKVLPTLLLFLLAPSVCILVLRIWLGEVLRMARASYFLWSLEKHVNSFFGSSSESADEDSLFDLATALRWEHWVRGVNRWKKTILMRQTYVSTASLLQGIAALSIVVGNLKLYLDLVADPKIDFVAEIRSLSRQSWLVVSLVVIWNIAATVFLIRERKAVLNAFATYSTNQPSRSEHAQTPVPAAELTRTGPDTTLE